MNMVKKVGPRVKNSTINFFSYCFHGGSKPELARMQKKALKKKHTERAHKGVNPNTGYVESNLKSYFFRTIDKILKTKLILQEVKCSIMSLLATVCRKMPATVLELFTVPKVILQRCGETIKILPRTFKL